MKVLVVEDDSAVAQTLNLLFSSINYAVDVADDGKAALAMVEAFEYDFIVLDVILPDLNGIDVCQQLRAKGFQKPILLLTGQGGAHQKAIALNAGADDYVVKPFDAEELVARVQALLRRGSAVTGSVLRYGNLFLDANTQKVTYKTHLLSLTPKEYAILELFLRHKQKPFNAATIIDRAWDSIDSPGEEAVRVHIKDLRQKLRQAGAPKDLIQTVYRRGYRLNPIYDEMVGDATGKPLNPLQIAELQSTNEQLRTALDELRLTQDKLHQKHQELEIAHQTIERERQELRKARDELELRVAERTSELVAANALLSQQKEQLRAVGEHLQLVVDVVQAGSAEVNLVTGETVWSDRLYQLLGYALREVEPSYETWRNRIHPDDLHRIETELRVGNENGGDGSFEYRILHPDGSVRWLLAKRRTLLDELGRVQRRLWAIVEIGDRKQLEATLLAYNSQKLALQQSEQKFQHFAERSHFVIWMSDVAAFRAIYINPAYEKIWGRSSQSLIERPKSWLESIHPEDLALVEQKLKKEQLGQSTEVEYRIVRPDGSIRWIWDRGFPLQSSGEAGIFGRVAEDITERKQAELALQHQLERMHLIAEITQSIRQTLELEQILQVAVDGVRHLLQTDRVLIFQFDCHWQGSVVAESAIPELAPMLSIAINDLCFKERYIEPYRQGRVCQINDLANSNLQPCHVEFLSHFQVKANLVVPILQTDRETTDQLWGLLIAHSCLSPRAWQIEEVVLLQQLANQLGVAIEQSDLYQQTRRELLERQRTESELRSSESRYRLLFDRNPHPIWVLDAENLGFMAVNRAAIELYGYSQTEFLRLTLASANIFYPEDLPQIIELYCGLAADSQQSLGIWRQIRRDGKQIEVEMLSHAFTFEGQAAFLVMVTDISERLQAERKIREQAALLDIASDAILVRDLEQRILYWNRGAEKLYGWAASEAIGQPANLLLGDTEEVLAEIMQNLLYSGEWRGELTKQTKAGKQVTVEARWTLVKNEVGQAKFILSVNTDISEKKLLEAQFYRAQRLESLGTLAGGIAHDLNNVFTPILAIAQMMRSARSQQLQSKSGDLLQLLEDSAKRGAKMVSQILTFARGMEGKRIPIQIGMVLKDVIKVIESTFPKSIEIGADIPGDNLGLVSADSTHIHQIFLNLCVNSRDAMPNGGMLTCSAQKCYIDSLFAQMNLDAREGDYILITISDTGVGIAPELQDRIFEPFFTTKPISEGTGLGLSVVLGMVKNYGGFLEVSSQVGKGTQIAVYLPLVEGTSQVTQEIASLPQGSGQLVLIVDDDTAVRRINQSMLESYNYQTLVARDGIEAIAVYAKHQERIELILIDIMMPNMDGVSAISALRKIDSNVKIVAISGLSSNREAALNAGASAFLPKPYTLEELLMRLTEQLGG